MTPTNQDAFATFLVEFGKFREENQREHSRLREDIERRHGELLAEYSQLRTDMHKELNSQLRWMIGTIGGMGVALLATVITSVVYIAGRLS